MRKQVGAALLALCLLLGVLPATALAAEKMAGNWIDSAETVWYEERPDAQSYEIGSAAQLAGLAQLVNAGNSFSGKTITLTADIDLAGREWTPIGGGGTDGQFRGDFDGQGHTISDLKITRGLSYTAENKSVGLFGATQDGEIRNFTLYNADVAGSGYVAAVVGGDAFLESKVTGVRVTGSVRIFGYWYAGGIVGNGYTTVADCSVEGDGTDSSYIRITGGYAGGIVGYMGEGNCVTTGCTVKNIAVEGAYNGIGGVNGILHYGNTIRDCTLENVAVWQNTAPEEDGRIYCGAFAGTYLDNNGKNPPAVRNCTFSGELYSGPEKTGVLEAGRYVGSLWYGAQPPSTVEVEGCTIHVPPAAQVGGETYDTLAQAFEAARTGEDRTVTILRDVSAANWSAIGGFSGLTVEGNGHVLTVDGQAFASAGGNTFRDLTIDLSGASGGYALNAGPGDTFTNVTIKGNGGLLHGILVEGTDADDETVIIDGCTFEGMQNAVCDSESGKVENLIVRNSTLKGGAGLILRSPRGQFTGNTLDGGALSIAGADQTVSGNSFVNGSCISFCADGASFRNNRVESESHLKFAGADGQNWDLSGNDLGEKILVELDRGITAATVTLPVLSKRGYTFDGWYNGETRAESPYTMTAEGSDVLSVTMTARWTKESSSTGGTSSGNKTETVTNPDGSTTTTVTRPNGTVTETTRQPDGSQQVVETKPDGTITQTNTDVSGNRTETVTNTNGSGSITVTNADGASSSTTVDQTGKSETQVKLPAAVVEEAREKGETVSLPMPGVSASADRADAPVVKVELSGSDAAKVEIPVEHVTAGTVAVIVKADGTEEIVKTSLTTESGVALTLSDGDTVKIVDNTKQFEDVSDDHWGAGAVTFAASRELFNGTSETTFTPAGEMTRAMVVTVLARYDGVDTAGGDTWYQQGNRWAVENGVSDGTDLDSPVSREQLATMLWRLAGSPAAEGGLEGYHDGSAVSGWAADAMAWAVRTGLIQGTGEGALNPRGSATRAEVAAILQRFVTAVH